MAKIKLRNTDVYFVLFFLLFTRCLAFWLKVYANINLFQIFSYFDFTVTLYLLFVLLRKNLSVSFLIICIVILISFCYNVFIGTKINESFSYLFSLCNILICLYTFPHIDCCEIDMAKLRKTLIGVSLIFVAMYEISSHYAISRNSESDYYEVERVYKEGFVLSHTACYYLSVLGYFLYLLRVRFLSICLWVYIITLGARVGIIYISIAIIMIFIGQFNNLSSLIYKYKYLLFGGIVCIFFVVGFLVIQKVGSDGLMVFTSGRSVFWMNAWNKIYRDGYSWVNFFGRGPKYSFVFNERTFGLKIWMHNDFMDLLFNLGFLGLFIYLNAFVYYFNRVNAMFLFFVFTFSAIFNGFMTYDPLFIILLDTLFIKKIHRIVNKKIRH